MLLCLFLFCHINFAFASRWQLSERLKAKINAKALQAKMPQIDNPDELQALMVELVTQYPLASLNALYDGEEIVIDGLLVEYVLDIEVAIKTQTLKRAVAKTVIEFRGSLDLPQTQENIVESLKRDLADRGYFFPKIALAKKGYKGGLQYYFEVQVGPLCRISKVSHDFDPKDVLDTESLVGEVCSESIIQRKVEQLEEKAKASGYRTARVRIQKMVNAGDKEQGHLILTGDLGERVLFSVAEKDTFFVINDLFKDEAFDNIDPYITDPQQMADELLKHYINDGYLDAKVNTPTLKTKGSTKEYLFNIDKGPRYYIRNVIIDGNRVFTTTQLLELMEMNISWQSDLPQKRDDIVKSMDKIKNMYEQQGYWDMRVNYPQITKNQATAQTELILFIKEGKQRILEEIEFTGNIFFKIDDFAKISDLKFGDPINKGTLKKLEESLLDIYLNEGFNYCQVSVTAVSWTNERNMPTKIVVKIDEGPRVKIGDILIKGLSFTHEKVVKRELLFKKGEWYNPAHISESRRALLNLGIFRSVQISPRDQFVVNNQSKVIDIVVDLSEGNHGTVSFGPGYKYKKGFQYSSEVSYNNIGGEGRKVTLKGAISQEEDQESISNDGSKHGKVFLGRKVALGYVEPYLLGSPLDGKIAVSHVGVADSIWKISNTFTSSVTYKFKKPYEGVSLTPYYTYKLSKDEGSREQYESLVSTGPSRIGRVGTEARIDRRDNISWPENGYFARLDVALARPHFGGSFQFFQWDVYYKKFFKLRRDLVFDFSVNMTAYENVTSTDHSQGEVLPSSERLFAGGSNRVRGFDRQLGPYVYSEGDKPEVLGATKRNVLSLELRQRFTPNIGASVFIDSGNSFFSADEIAKYNDRFSQASGSKKSVEDNFAYQYSDILSDPSVVYDKHYNSYGTALNIITPIGPINIFLSYPISEPKSESCKENKICYPRANQAAQWYRRFQLDISIGSEF